MKIDKSLIGTDKRSILLAVYNLNEKMVCRTAYLL